MNPQDCEHKEWATEPNGYLERCLGCQIVRPHQASEVPQEARTGIAIGGEVPEFLKPQPSGEGWRMELEAMLAAPLLYPDGTAKTKWVDGVIAWVAQEVRKGKVEELEWVLARSAHYGVRAKMVDEIKDRLASLTKPEHE